MQMHSPEHSSVLNKKENKEINGNVIMCNNMKKKHVTVSKIILEKLTVNVFIRVI